jgi:hypothetical protein
MSGGEVSKSVAKRKVIQKGEPLREFVRCYGCGLVFSSEIMERVKIVGLVSPKYICLKCRMVEVQNEPAKSNTGNNGEKGDRKD